MDGVSYASFALWVALAFFAGVNFGLLIAGLCQSAKRTEEAIEDEEYNEMLSRL